MTPSLPSECIIWATRGYSWGFKFLLDGGHSDPLPVYEEFVGGLEGLREGYHRVGSVVALRLQDPKGRRDTAGRMILHEFVVAEPLSNGIETLYDGLSVIWPMVAEVFATAWGAAGPQAPPVIRRAVDESLAGPA